MNNLKVYFTFLVNLLLIYPQTLVYSPFAISELNLEGMI
jgi:hypothetical protein